MVRAVYHSDNFLGRRGKITALTDYATIRGRCYARYDNDDRNRDLGGMALLLRRTFVAAFRAFR